MVYILSFLKYLPHIFAHTMFIYFNLTTKESTFCILLLKIYRLKLI